MVPDVVVDPPRSIERISGGVGRQRVLSSSLLDSFNSEHEFSFTHIAPFILTDRLRSHPRDSTSLDSHLHNIMQRDDDDNHSTTLTNNPPAWSSEILPAALKSHGLRCQDRTPAWAQRAISQKDQQLLTAEDFIEQPEIEQMLMDAFIEDSFEGKVAFNNLINDDCYWY